MKQQTTHYNDLIPPQNPAYPWKPEGWQLLCYYCAQPIYETTPEAGYRQRTIYMRGRWLHRETDEQACEPGKLRPESEIDDPRCHCCKIQELPHGMLCSVAGPPYPTATPMSQKEDELIGLFGWGGKGSGRAYSTTRTASDNLL